MSCLLSIFYKLDKQYFPQVQLIFRVNSTRSKLMSTIFSTTVAMVRNLLSENHFEYRHGTRLSELQKSLLFF